MSLFIVSVSIGNSLDISLRAIEILKSSEVIIGEEQRIVSGILKNLNIFNKKIELLNEHSTYKDILYLKDLCKKGQVAIISDCGTPNFCDPGYDLIKACRKDHVFVSAIPGASSLMCLLSLCGRKVDEFIFKGFLPRKKDQRDRFLNEIKKNNKTQIIFDTPYRLQKTINELNNVCPEREAILGIELTTENEKVLENKIKIINKELCNLSITKGRFVLIIYKQ